MSPELTPWVLFGGFISLLGMTIIIGLRAILRGSIVAGRHYDDANIRGEQWRRAAETAMAANVEMSNHIARLVSAVEQSTATTRETQQLVRQLVQIGRAHV